MLFYNDLFRILRQSKCFTLKEIGERVGVTKQTVQKWETGVVSPRPANIYAIARVLGCSAVDISNLHPEKNLVDHIGHVIEGNSKQDEFCVPYTENFRTGLICEIIKLDIDPVAKDIVLKAINAYQRDGK